jgi:hypothetical protein
VLDVKVNRVERVLMERYYLNVSKEVVCFEVHQNHFIIILISDLMVLNGMLSSLIRISIADDFL